MEPQSNATFSEISKSKIFAPLSFLASATALLSIVSIYGSIFAAILGICFGLLALRNNQKALGTFGIALNVLVLVATALMMVFIYFFTK